MKKQKAKKNEKTIDETEFITQVNSLVQKIKASQLEVGRLIHLYIGEYGNTYGQGIYDYIAEITDLSRRSAQNYHKLYRLESQHGKSANLPNLNLSVKYQMSRLLDHPDAETLIPKIATKAVEEKMRTSDMEQYITNITEIDKKKKKKPKGKPKGNPASRKARQMFTSEQEGALRKAVEILQYASHPSTEYDNTINMTDHQLLISQVMDGITKYLERLSDEGMADNLEASIGRMISDVRDIQEKISARRNVA